MVFSGSDARYSNFSNLPAEFQVRNQHTRSRSGSNCTLPPSHSGPCNIDEPIQKMWIQKPFQSVQQVRPRQSKLPRIGPIRALQVRKPSRSARKRIIKSTRIESNSPPQSDNMDELQKLRAQMKKRESTDVEERVKQIQNQQFDQQKSVLLALEQQKQMLWENQQKEREIARLEREALQSQMSTGAEDNCCQSSCQSQLSFFPQTMQMPQYVHPQYGPAVFDYQYGQWTYPYRQWYGPYAQQEEEQEVEEEIQQAPSPPEKVSVPTIPVPEKIEFSCQKDLEEEPKPVLSEIQTQTTIREKEISTMGIQTSPEKVPTKAIVKPRPQPTSGLSEDQAASIITRRCKKNVMRKRENDFNKEDQGFLFTRKRNYNKVSGAMEILSVYVVHTPDRRCLCVRFSIFNYATKQFVYFGVYEKLVGLQDFDIEGLYELAKASLDQIEFERAPFKLHILCLQSIINTSRIVQRPIPKIKVNKKERSPSPPKQVVQQAQVEQEVEIQIKPIEYNKPKEPEIIYVDKPKAVMVSSYTQHEEDESWMIMDWETRKAQQQSRQQMSQQQACTYIQKCWRGHCSRKQYKIIYRTRSVVMIYQMKQKVAFGTKKSKYFVIGLYKHYEGREIFYTLRAKEASKSKRCHPVTIQQYKNVKLPEDPAMLCYYMQQATVIKLDPKNGKVSILRLMRMKIENFKDFQCQSNMISSFERFEVDGIGCNLKAQFALLNYPNHICKIYKRIRWLNESCKVKVKDWKVEVTQLNGAESSDYLVVRRLPCPVNQIEDLIQHSLGIQFNKRIVPPPILHLFWEVRCITVYSQSFYDLNSLRFNTELKSSYYFSQNIETGARVHSQEQLSSKTWDPLYEIYVQVQTPINSVATPYRYHTDAQLQRKLHMRHHKHGPSKFGDSDESSSDSEEESDPYKYVDDQCYWDESQIEKMQLDEETAKKQYIKVTCTKSIDKQDQDYFKIEKGVARWGEQEYQFLMENLILRQIVNSNTGEININVVGLKIRNQEQRFSSDSAWISYIRYSQQPEIFMVQEYKRWNNKNVVFTVYNAKFQGGGYLIEAINVDKPLERSCIRVPTLGGMRGSILSFYLESSLKVLSESSLDVMAFDCSPDSFKSRMALNPRFKDWVYEEISEIEANAQEIIDPAVQAMLQALQGRKQAQDAQALAQEMKQNREAMRLKRVKAQQRKIEKSEKALSPKQEKEPEPPVSIPQLEPEGEEIAKFEFASEITPTKTAKVRVTVTKFESPLYFKLEISNLSNQSQDDSITLKAFRLPGGLKITETRPEKFQKAFKSKLKIVWQSATAVKEGEPRRMLDAFVDNTVVREEVIHKIVEVPVYPDGQKPVKKAKKDKKKKDKARSPSSDESQLSVGDEELVLIKEDIKLLKSVIKTIKKKALSMDKGISEWFKHFDQDGSDEIELNEFIAMMQYIGIQMEDRVGIMMFRVFDRANQGFFTQTMFTDIVMKRMIPNYKKIVYIERERFKMHGLAIKFPKRVAPEVKVVYKTKEVPKEVIKEKIVEKIVIQEKIVDKIVEVEKPIYVEKIVEKPIYIQQPQQQQPQYIVQQPQHIVYQQQPHVDVHYAPPQQHINVHHAPPQQHFDVHYAPPQQHIDIHHVPPQVQHAPAQQQFDIHHVQEQQAPIQQQQVTYQQPQRVAQATIETTQASIEPQPLIKQSSDKPYDESPIKEDYDDDFDSPEQPQVPEKLQTHQQYAGIKEEVKHVEEVIVVSFVQNNINDFIKPLNTLLKQKKMSADQLVSNYDKDKNYLISVKEIGMVFQKELSYQINDGDLAMITQNLRTMFSRPELKRAEFKQFVEQTMQPVKFDAKEAIQCLTKIGMLTQINKSFFDKFLIKGQEVKTVCIPAFKSAIYDLKSFDQKQIDNLANFLDKNENGLITVDNFMQELQINAQK